MGDPYTQLLDHRIIFLGGEVNDSSADAIVSHLLLLDAMKMCSANVHTICFGLAASMGALLLGAGTKGNRYSMPNSRIMIHQPLGGASGVAVDIEIQAREIMYHKANLNNLMAKYTGHHIDKIDRDTDRDRYMSPIEAKDYGLIDHIIGGANASFKIDNCIYDIPKSKQDYISWGHDNTEFSNKRHRGNSIEPFTRPLS